MCFFFFKQKTAYEVRISDWSSDVCSSDLARPAGSPEERVVGGQAFGEAARVVEQDFALLGNALEQTQIEPVDRTHRRQRFPFGMPDEGIGRGQIALGTRRWAEPLQGFRDAR